MAQYTAIVTGGNLGLGFETAKWIAKQPNWAVVLACRSIERGREAANSITDATGNKNVHVMQLDLGSMASIRSFVREFEGREDLPVLKALINNAGLQVVNPAKTDDGFEMTFGVNHLGHFLLMNLILKKRVFDKTPLRVIFVSSGTHDPNQKTGIPVPQYNNARELAYPDPVPVTQQGWKGRQQYSTSKLCNILCTYEMNRRLAKKGITHVQVNAFDPGLMPGTGLARDYNPILQLIGKVLIYIVIMFMKNGHLVSTSGANLGSVAVLDKYASVTGKYFEGQKLIDSSADSYDENKARDLWEASVELVKLTKDEAIL